MSRQEWKDLKKERLASVEEQKSLCLSTLFNGIDKHDWTSSFVNWTFDPLRHPIPSIQFEQPMPQHCDWYSKFIVRSANEHYCQAPLQLSFRYEKQRVHGWKGYTVLPPKVIIKAHLFPPEQ